MLELSIVTAGALLQNMVTGEKVAVLVKDHHRARHAYLDLMELAEDLDIVDGIKAHHTAGRPAKISLEGAGSIHFHIDDGRKFNQSFCGTSYHQIYVSNIRVTEFLERTLRPALAAHDAGCIVGVWA